MLLLIPYKFSFLHVQCDGKRILWQRLVDIYEQDTLLNVNMRIVPKLKFEYINLTSYSKTRVDLAAQVYTMSVCKLILKFYMV